METGKYDPRRFFDLWLDVFEEAPAAERPTFVYRRTTSNEWEIIAEVIDRNPPDDKSQFTQWLKSYREDAMAALLVGLEAVKNHVDLATGDPVTECKDVDTLKKLINPREAIELLSKRLRGGQLSAAEKKPSGSPS